MQKDKIASGLGSVLEWYDFALYGYFAPLIAQLYFPSQTNGLGLLKTFCAFAVGFFARPVGALLSGALSDKYGRIVCLKITPILITIPTILVAILPTQQQIGTAASILLVFLRIMQGICVGGEYTNNIIYLCETGNPKHRYFIGSIGACTGSLGIFLASSMATICYISFPESILIAWGWRIAFAIAAPLGILTYFLRKNMKESLIFQHLYTNNLVTNKPILNSLKYQWKDYLIAMGLTFLPATSFYYVFMFLPNFLSASLNFNSNKILGDNSLSLLARLCIIPIIGTMADKLGGVKISQLASLLFIVFSYPLLLGIVCNPKLSSICLFAFAMLTTLNAAATPGLLISLLKPTTRCTILSFTFNFSFGVFGGIVPALNLWLSKKTGNNMASVYYLIFAALITFTTTIYFRKGYSFDEKKLYTYS